MSVNQRILDFEKSILFFLWRPHFFHNDRSSENLKLLGVKSKLN